MFLMNKEFYCFTGDVVVAAGGSEICFNEQGILLLPLCVQFYIVTD